MRKTMAAVMMVLMMAVMSHEGAAAAHPELNWCSESSIDNLRITKKDKPELSQIEIVVNGTLEENVVDEVFIRQQTPCEGITQEEVVILGADAMLVLESGEITLLWRPPDSLPILQRIQNFCLSVNHDSPEGPSWTTFLAKFCFPTASLQLDQEREFCSDKTCVRKCCPQGMSLIHGGSMCDFVEDGKDWHLSLDTEADTPLHMLYGPPRLCESALFYDDFFFLPSGAIEMNGLSADPHKYCIDASDDTSHPRAMVCMEEVTSWHCEWKYEVFKPVLLGISALCLVIVWTVYVSVPALRNRNEGRCIISLVSALFVAFITLITLNFISYEDVSTSCVVAARICHLSLLASYFWMNVLSFHTFVTLRSQRESKWERPLVFGLYSLYGWGCPVVVVVVGAVLDAIQCDVIRPHIDTSCWFPDTASQWAYLYGLMVVLLVVNAMFFVGCVGMLSCGHRRVTFTPSSGQHHTQRGSAWLYVRLFILMGILWVTEVLSWSLFYYCSILEWIFDTINGLQGVLVLLVTVCFRKNLKVFHCGRPQLIQKSRYGKDTATETSEMAGNPLVS